MPPKPSPSPSRYQMLPTPSSMAASQSLSSPSHVSGAPGFRAASVSSQSVASVTKPAGGAQPLVTIPIGSPKPSPSASSWKVIRTPSSTIVSQSLSMPSQASGAPGLRLAIVSSQSVASLAYPAGALHASAVGP